MKFARYTSIENHYREKYITILEEYGYADIPYIAHEKIHGCLSGDTKITTREFGEVELSYLIDNKLKCHVMSLNTEDNEIEWDEVINFQNVPNDDKQWYEVELDDGTILQITGNHKVWIPKLKKYVAVKELTGDEYLMKK